MLDNPRVLYYSDKNTHPFINIRIVYCEFVVQSTFPIEAPTPEATVYTRVFLRYGQRGGEKRVTTVHVQSQASQAPYTLSNITNHLVIRQKDEYWSD